METQPPFVLVSSSSAALLPFSTISTPSFDLQSFPTKSKSKIPLLSLQRKQKLWNSKEKQVFISFAASSSSSNFGGWDDLECSSSSSSENRNDYASGEFEQFRKFLVSIGIDDRKHVYLFLTGFASALAISRVRFSSVAIFPASLLLLFVGFSMGILRGGGTVLVKNNKNLTCLETQSSCSAATSDKLRAFLSELDVKMSELKIGMEGAIKSNSIQVEIGEIKRYHGIVESVRGVLEAFSAGYGYGDQEPERNLNHRSSRRKRELGVIGFDFFQSLIMGGLFKEISVGLKPHKAKVAVKQESKEQMNSVQENNQITVDGRNGSVQAKSNKIEVEGSPPSSDNILGNIDRDSFPQEAPKTNPAVNRSPQQDMVGPNDNVRMLSDPKIEPWHKVDSDGSGLKANRSKVLSEGVNRNSPEMAPSNELIFDSAASNMINRKPFDHSRYQGYKDDMLSLGDGLYTRNNGLQFSNEYRNFQKLGLWNQGEAQTPHGEVSNQDGLGIIPQDNGKLGVQNGTCSQGPKEELEEATKVEEKKILNEQRYVNDIEQDETSSSPTMSSHEFNRHLKEANGLLKKAREYLMVEADDEMTEILLCKSSSLLSRALQMNPTSLQAVGQLGNTFLLHGELKLKKSRDLRALLSRSEYSSAEKGSRVQPERLKYEELSKDRIASILVDVCEECEELLIEAGRKYRMALSIDGNDVRALYNWGLALSFRAQLIADIGPVSIVNAGCIVILYGQELI